ncbi:MAG: hypothetical protein CMM85_13555 [Rhodothermaceae bacterium]|nr:hypothetical protein [Rhodothermaceae bacterium]
MEGGRTRSSLRSLGLLIPLVAGSGCTTVVDTVAAVFGPGEVGGVVDAHVVYRLRDDCPALMARTINHGYTVLTPLGLLADEGDPIPLRAPVEETGLFEGPVRTGQSIYRYIAPADSDTWAGEPVDIVAEVDAVRLDVDEAAARLVALCGPEPLPVPTDPTVPRLPPVQR